MLTSYKAKGFVVFYSNHLTSRMLFRNVEADFVSVISKIKRPSVYLLIASEV